MRLPLLSIVSLFVLFSNLSVAAEIWTDAPQASRSDADFAQRVVTANRSALAGALARAPMEFTNESPTEITLPLPDGTNQRFQLEESPVMDATLASNFPHFKTYRLFGIDDPSASGRIGLIDGTFHGTLHTANGTVWIDRISTENSYRTYYKHDFAEARRTTTSEFSCGVHYNPASSDSPVSEFRTLARTDGARRNYRLAVATTGEYTAFHGGTVNGGMAAITTTINRVNQIYNRDLNVHMTLVANNNLLIYTNSGTDPYTNNNGFTMLGQNQTAVDNVIGNANYDIGHVFSTGGGGVAGIRSVCSASRKAQGVTGLGRPTGDPFDIDYVAHEIGHQFGGNHTFNGTTGSCAGGNRNAGTAFEPGSGNTIMAYAGICGSENITNNSIATFHAGSIAEMTTFISAGGSCFTTPVPSSNGAPTVNAGSDYTIPRNTPFVLSGSATDPNGDTLTYQWDQLNAGSSSNSTTHGTDLGNNALFRSFLPTSSPARTLPQPSTLNGNTTDKAETLPSTARNLDFRLTARDQKGGVDSDDMRVTVNTASGPFRVSQPNTSVTLNTSQQQVIEWDVACTDNAAVGCSTVDILLSTDGGNTYPNTLIAATPNDGTEPVTITAGPTSSARVRVQCASNIFFDISDSNFSLASNSGTVLSATGGNHGVCNTGGNQPPTANAGPDQTVNSGSTVNLNGTGSSDPNGDPITFAWSETTGNGITLNNANTATPSFTAPATAATVTLQLTVADNNGAQNVDTVTITVNGPPPANGTPNADAGPNQSVNTGATVNLNGAASSDPDGDPITFAWTETSSTGITLNNANSATPSFTAPNSATTVTLQLTVTDNKGAMDTDSVSVVVSQPSPVNNPPIANAGADQTVATGATVNLNGGGSSDPDGDTITYAWSETTSSGVVLSNANTVSPSFTAPASATTVTLQLVVTDSRGMSGNDTVDVVVSTQPSSNPIPNADINSTGGGSRADALSLYVLAGFALIGLIHRRRERPRR